MVLLLAALIGLGVKVWTLYRMDPCDRYMLGDRLEGSTAAIAEGPRMVSVPCAVWILRQPVGAQAVVGVDAAVFVVFLVFLVSDIQRGWERRRARRMRW